ncbi:MAG: YaeQ family protein [Rubrivivax sp.]
MRTVQHRQHGQVQQAAVASAQARAVPDAVPAGQLVHWIEVGQPVDRRLVKACGRAERVSPFSYASSAPVWWSGIENKLSVKP